MIFDNDSQSIRSPMVIRAMQNVDRKDFVPPHLATRAYDDGPLPIGYGQTISQPFIVAYMTELLDARPTDKILEIGTGSGYQAAVLAQIVQEVFTIERIPQLAEAAKERFEQLKYTNIKVQIADGYFGWQSKAPFDGIIVTAAVREVPEALISQLKTGGRIVLPLGDPTYSQELQVGIKDEQGSLKLEPKLPVVFVPFTRD